MIDYENIVKTIVTPLIENPDALMIRVIPSENEKDVTIMIVAENDDTARLIGKRGNVANSLREIVSVAGKNEGKHIHLQFESFDLEEKE